MLANDLAKLSEAYLVVARQIKAALPTDFPFSFCFYEELPVVREVLVFRYFSRIVVSRAPAQSNMDNVPVGVDADHSDIARPFDREGISMPDLDPT